MARTMTTSMIIALAFMGLGVVAFWVLVLLAILER
jgi:hypothetical protein